MYAKVDVNEENWPKEHEREGQKHDSKKRILNPPWVSEALRDAPIGVVLRGFDGLFEDGLGEHVQQTAEGQPKYYPNRDVAAPEIYIGPDEVHDEVHDDAQVRELEGKPHVGPARQQLKLVAEPFGKVQYRQVDVRHFPERWRSWVGAVGSASTPSRPWCPRRPLDTGRHLPFGSRECQDRRTTPGSTLFEIPEFTCGLSRPC